MNPFVFSCITPHGGEIIPELSGDQPNRMGTTRESMLKLGEAMERANPDTIIVLTPHGTRIHGQFSITDSERMLGSLEDHGAEFQLERKVDRELARRIYEIAASKDLPIGMLNYGTSSGPYSCLPLDWGAMVPLRFMPNVPIVVITTSREVSLDRHVELGQVLKQVSEQTSKRIALIASCDWSHTHDSAGPYGFDAAASQLDEEVVQFIKTNDLEGMIGFSPEYIDAAKPDGIWQTMILAGAIPPENRKVEFLSYEAPTYFGLICTAYY
ncbi:extradiol ring-cleavage dioxygenase [Bacillus salitolerans]|uniref:Extradiol ring-cleavage dioxygenase n=1 Tax=Bacillus salitolerans TaxID=1437434 RepID=A0ABW4LWY0_9BACI